MRYTALAFMMAAAGVFACGPEVEPRPASQPLLVDMTIQFRDGTTAELELQPTDNGLRGFFSSGDDFGFPLDENPPGSQRFSTSLCTDSGDFELDVFGYPDAITGAVAFNDVREFFHEAAHKREAHPVDGTWAVSATYAASVTEIVVTTGELPMRGHGELLFVLFDGFAWDATAYTPAMSIEPPVCHVIASMPERSFSFWGMNVAFSADFTSAVVWQSEDDVTGTAYKIVEK